MYKSKTILNLILVFIFAGIVASCANQDQSQKVSEVKAVKSAEAIKPVEKIALWNGADFTGWKRFIPDSSVDVNTVWQITDGVIHCTGVPTGYLRTEATYADYKLHLEWRWTGEPGNSGVLLHSNGPDKLWPMCIEGQLKTGNAGDFYMLGGSSIAEQTDKKNLRIQKRAESNEAAPGEWNSYDITCKGDKISLVVNGLLQNEGSGASLQQGFICLQSEGKPIEFRNIYILPINGE